MSTATHHFAAHTSPALTAQRTRRQGRSITLQARHTVSALPTPKGCLHQQQSGVKDRGSPGVGPQRNTMLQHPQHQQPPSSMQRLTAAVTQPQETSATASHALPADTAADMPPVAAAAAAVHISAAAAQPGRCCCWRRSCCSCCCCSRHCCNCPPQRIIPAAV